MAVHQVGGVVDVPSDTKPEDDLAFLSWVKLDGNLDCGARIQGGPKLAGESFACHGRRIFHRSIASEKLGSVAGHASRPVVRVQKCDSVGEFHAVRVARKEGAGAGIDVRHHMEDCLRSIVAQHPLHVGRGRQSPESARIVAQLEHGKFHRRIHVDVDGELRMNAALVMFEDAVTEAMTGDGGLVCRTLARQGRWRPELTALLVAQIEGFPTRVADGVVVPRGKPELMRVLGPGVGRATFRQHGTEARVGQHVRPRRRCDESRSGRDDVLAPVGCEATDSIPQDEVGARSCHLDGSRGGFRVLAMNSERWREDSVALASLSQLVGQISEEVAQNDARHGLHQDAILVGNLVGRPDKNPARSIGHVVFATRGDERHDFVVQDLPVARVIFIPDHQIHLQSTAAPVRVGLNQLAHQFGVSRFANFQQHNGQVARNGVAPQAGLPAPVVLDHVRVSAQRGVGVQDGACQRTVQLCIGFAGIDLLQRHLAVGPSQIENAVGKATVLVFVDQSQANLAGITRSCDHIDGHEGIRLKGDPLSDGDDRVEN